jgi:hypothetical protein
MGRLIRKATTENMQKIIDCVLKHIDRNMFYAKCEQDFLFASEEYMNNWAENNENDYLTKDGVIRGTIFDVLDEYGKQYQSETETYICNVAIHFERQTGEFDTTEMYDDLSKMEELVNAVCNKFGYEDLFDAIAKNPKVDMTLLKAINKKMGHEGQI